MLTRVPAPTFELKLMMPPWFETMREVTANPSPDPPLACLVVKKGSVTLAIFSEGMPIPSSATSTTIQWPSSDVLTAIFLSRDGSA